MTLVEDAYAAGVTDALEKFGSRGRVKAREWGRQAQDFAPGSPEHTRRLGLAARAGEVSFAPTSRPVDLGQIHPGGSEGPVRLNIQPQGGQAAATAIKTVPTTSALHNSATLDRRKAMAASGLNQSEHFAKLYDARELASGAHQYTSEYVSGPSGRGASPEEYMRTRIGAGRDVRRAGAAMGEINPMALHDAKPSNMVRDDRTGKLKLVDYHTLTAQPRAGTAAASANKPYEAETTHRYDAVEPSQGSTAGWTVKKLPREVLPLTPAGNQLTRNPQRMPRNQQPYVTPTRAWAEGEAAANNQYDAKRDASIRNAAPLFAQPAPAAPAPAAPAPPQELTNAGSPRRAYAQSLNPVKGP